MARDEPFATAVFWPAADLQRSDGVLLGPRLAAVVAEAISDEFSRTILSSSVSQGKTVVEISNEEGIPQSTCYKRIRHLVDEGAMVVERIVVASTGRKYSVYRSAFSRLEVRLEDGVISAKGTPNPAAADKAGWASRVSESPGPLPREAVAPRHESGRRSRSRGGRS
jgi:transposase-like protein